MTVTEKQLMSQTITPPDDDKRFKNYDAEVCLHKWISVENYLPPFHKTVLLYMPHIEELPEYAVGYLEADGDYYFNERSNNIDSQIAIDITHWMPLPEPPK